MGVLGTVQDKLNDAKASFGDAIGTDFQEEPTDSQPDSHSEVNEIGGAPLFAGGITGVGSGASMLGSLGKLGSIGSKLKSAATTKTGAGLLGGLGFGAAGETTDIIPSINPFSGDGVGTGEENRVDLGEWGHEDYGSGGSSGQQLPFDLGQNSDMKALALVAGVVAVALAVFGGDM